MRQYKRFYDESTLSSVLDAFLGWNRRKFIA